MKRKNENKIYTDYVPGASGRREFDQFEKICGIGAKAFRDFIVINRVIGNAKDEECNEC